MLLDARDLHIAYGDIRAVNGVNFYLEKGELVSIIGANGAGKTSILNGIMGIVPLKNGKIHFDNKEMTSLARYPDGSRTGESLSASYGL
jgi:branched-chain amino acid transport system ATP-binding protein